MKEVYVDESQALETISLKTSRDYCTGMRNVPFRLSSASQKGCIHYLHRSHNTPLLSPKNLHRHCFRFLLRNLHVPGEIANNDYAFLFFSFLFFFFFFFGGGGGGEGV